MIAHVAVSSDDRRIKFAEDVDTLSPDIQHYRKSEFHDMESLKVCAGVFEVLGYRVCIDFTEYFYETA